MRNSVLIVLCLCRVLVAADSVENERAIEASALFRPPTEIQNAEKSPDAPEVRLVAMKTDIAKRYRYLVPPLPIPPFSDWRKWMKDQEDAVHCVLEWRTEEGKWFYAELRSTEIATKRERVRVGWGEFPGTGYDAYGIYINNGRVPRDKDDRGRELVVTLDEVISCDYRKLENEVRKYGARDFGRDSGTKGDCRENRCLGGPAFKPSQNSNTMVSYVLKACGVKREAPARAVGWDTKPKFPFSSNKDAFMYDNQP